MRHLFDSLTLADLRDFISTSREEDLQLEFKTINTADISNSDDKRNLARAISGFANSSGGLIVWGIDARRNQSGIDVASSAKEISPLSHFVNRLNEFTGFAVSPLVDKVVHRSIPSHADSGFAVSLVPESDSGPHMAKFHEDRYFKRSGDRFYRMEHFDLEDMFGRRRKPSLQIHKRLVAGHSVKSSEGRTLTVQLLLSLENSGRGTAKAPFFAVVIKSKHQISQYGIDGNGNFGLPRIVQSTDTHEFSYGGAADFVIHPGVIHDVTGISIKVRNDVTRADDIQLVYRITAEDTRMSAGELVVPGADLLEFVRAKMDAA
jgi:hypothetical protein